MILECGCPQDYPDWHNQDVDLSLHAAHVLPIASLFHMPLSYESYRQRQQLELDQLELSESWPGFSLTRTGLFRGQLIRLLDNETSPCRHFRHLENNFRLQGYLHQGGIGTIRDSVRAQQMQLLDAGRMPKEMYLSYLTCPRCNEQRGGDKILLLRRWRESPVLARKTGKA